ncbi:MAG: hypothetical protein ACPGWR_20565 [Ardenticatenaceae bacterium]
MGWWVGGLVGWWAKNVVVKHMVQLFPTRLTDGATDFRPSGAEEA